MYEDEEDDEEACAYCADPSWIEGNWLLLCDGEHCGKAFHTRCLEEPLDELPEGDWFCPCCCTEVAAMTFESSSPSLLAAISICRLAWHAAWHAAFEVAGGCDVESRRSLQRFTLYTARIAERLPVELVADAEWLCWHASLSAAYERKIAVTPAEHHDAATDSQRSKWAKEQRAFEARADAIRKRLPAALAESMVGLATSAASHAAHSRLPSTNGPVEKLPTGAIARGTDMAAARALKDFEAAASEVQRLHARLPPLWRGTPVDPAPIAEACKWMAWNAAWHTANERSGLGGDARKAKLALEEHADRLTSLGASPPLHPPPIPASPPPPPRIPPPLSPATQPDLVSPPPCLDLPRPTWPVQCFPSSPLPSSGCAGTRAGAPRTSARARRLRRMHSRHGRRLRSTPRPSKPWCPLGWRAASSLWPRTPRGTPPTLEQARASRSTRHRISSSLRRRRARSTPSAQAFLWRCQRRARPSGR